jgi:hypothetical protein
MGAEPRGRIRPAGAVRAFALNPFALPQRFAATDDRAEGGTRAIELDRTRVTVSRHVAGIPMRVALPVGDYLGVAVHLWAGEAGERDAVAVVLEHRDPALSVPLYVAEDGEDVVAEWQLWGRVLGRPLLVVALDGTMREPFARIGQVVVKPAAPRRRRSGSVGKRRPRILSRRKPGRLTATTPVHRGEREIIARN